MAADPLWYKDAIIYEAHVKTFFDGNNDGIGDFPGLTQKLDYLQALGITCIWLLPFFPSPLKDDGYDISDYTNVHPSYGTLDDFRAFVRAAHERQIRVLIELVVNHTSDQHPWFQRARRAPPGSPERNFYVWSDTDKKFAGTRIIFSDTERSNWAFDPVAGQYYWHRFFSHQPDLNHDNPAVVDAVIDVMRFWFDLGVDGMRLDAVAYLCVREGTSNENLPETHAVLRRMRAVLDAEYQDKMLLAEVNQWPSDVRPYFGNGDECHMAFHFPLMPRMFMAVKQEDRHGIVEILSQTPDIPVTCQWALFLRNHDELTLEMVTDEERDYMYSVYANDPRMVVNGGIRRRLAPLVENSRRREELLNALLFSLPGTPIIYYGDEIGMGDNIYLGDRNGVRTPMQWSSDRNGGFSRADPARLCAPAIQDPLYGYEVINVEAEERLPFSLLNWMKRLIALRKHHRVLGSGSLEFVNCPNRKVLAYVRRDERETILVVANLSRSVQPAVLDLRTNAGLVPVEMIGLTEFPRIVETPYFLSLGAYASYWFTLQEAPVAVTPRAVVTTDANALLADSLPALLVGVDWQNVFDGGTRIVLEHQALVPFLVRQPWFNAKSDPIRRAYFADWVTLRSGTSPAFLTIVGVERASGQHESYAVPLALVSGAAADRALSTTPGAVLSRITGARKGIVLDGMLDEDERDRMEALIAGGADVATARGRVRGAPLASTTRHTPLVLKLFRRIEPAPNPAFEIGHALASRGFKRTPLWTGALEYRTPGAPAATIAVTHPEIDHQGSGWDFTIDELRRYYERVTTRVGRSTSPPPRVARNTTAPPPFFAAVEREYLATAAALGRRTAELHQALASATGSAFAPETIDPGESDALVAHMHDHAEQTLDTLDERREALDGRTKALADEVLSHRELVLSLIDDVRGLAQRGDRIRVHGDYHLGQVLRADEDFLVSGFDDGTNGVTNSRAKHSPLKDIASMMRSYSYAAYAALSAFTVHAPENYEALEPWADTWQRWTADAFLKGYLSVDGATTWLPSDPDRRALLRAFLLDKALDELGYELDHRPEWLRVPLAGIGKLLEGQEW